MDEDWLTRYRGWVYGLGFGAQLGFGAVTIVTSASTYAAGVLALLAGSWWAGLTIGLTFGLVRSLPILTVRAADTPERLRAAVRRLRNMVDVTHRLVLAVLAGAAMALFATALT